MDDKTQLLSALMDDALDDEEILAVVDALATEPALQAAWSSWHLAGDALRARAVPAMDITDRVMAAIAAGALGEPDATSDAAPNPPAKPRKPVSL